LKTSNGRTGCIGAFVGALSGVVCAYAVYNAFIATPFIMPPGSDRQFVGMVAGISRAVEEVKAMLIGLVLGTPIGVLVALRLVNRKKAASRKSANDDL
jgi:ABC-type lipoprotein release transport system permease subunit